MWTLLTFPFKLLGLCIGLVSGCLRLMLSLLGIFATPFVLLIIAIVIGAYYFNLL